jgi:predicted  nucleic acid-binding Zn-ribbon protein
VTSDGSRLFVGDLTGALMAYSIADAKPLGTPDTNPPRLDDRLKAAEAALVAATQAHNAADAELLQARKALETILAQVAEAEKRAAELGAAAEKSRAGLTAAEADAKRYRDEAAFAKQPR